MKAENKPRKSGGSQSRARRLSPTQEGERIGKCIQQSKDWHNKAAVERPAEQRSVR